MLSNDYLNPHKPAQLVYLILEKENNDFLGELFVQILFIPSDQTRSIYQINPVPRTFETAFDRQTIGITDYKDQYGFVVPLGQYNPNLQKWRE